MPVAIPPLEGSAELLDLLDGLVFTGGADLEPAIYRQEAHPESAGFHDGRDRAELELIRGAAPRHARARHLPGHAAAERRPRRRPPPAPRQRHPQGAAGALHVHEVWSTRARAWPRCWAPARAPTPATTRRRTGSATACARAPGQRTARWRRWSCRRPARPGRAVASRGGRGARRPALPRAGRPGHDLPAGGGMSAAAVEGLVIGGDRVAAAEGASFDVTNPATGAAAGERRLGGGRGRRPGGGRRSGRLRGLGGALAGHARPAHAPVRGAGRGARGGAGAARVPKRRHADRRRPRPARHDRGRDPLLRRRGGQVLRPHDPGRARRRGDDVPRADRRRRPDHAVELPAQHRQLEDRPRARRRQHGRAEAGVADAALRPSLRRAGGRGGHPGRGAERRPRAGRDGRKRARRASRGRQDRLHRLDRGGRGHRPARGGRP